MTLQIEKNRLVKYEGDDEVVTLPEEVEIIADSAFYGAKNLRTVHMTDHVQEIGTYAFYNCENLQEIELPDSIYYMGSAVFSRCTSLRRVKMPARLSSVPKITFYQCENLQEVILPKALSRLNRACFEQCHSLQKIELPGWLKVLEPNVFDDCTSLKEIHLPERLTEIGDNVFFACTALKYVNIPSSVEKIGKGAFETRSKLTIEVQGKQLIKAEMLDNNWNMNWNFGANGRWNGKNEENYKLYGSYLPNVDLKMWKPVAQCVLAVNYLETYRTSIPYYDTWIAEHKADVLEKMVSDKRWDALNCALDHELLCSDDVEPYLNRISDREERAKLLDRRNTHSVDDLFDLL